MLLLLVPLSVLLSGCAGVPGGNGPNVDGAEIVQGYDCLAPNLADWSVALGPSTAPDPQHPDAPEAGRVPTSFTPTTVVRCDLGATIEDAQGLWSGVTEVTLTGDFAPLLAALAEPDDGTWPGPCTADMELVPPLWLVSADGDALNAYYPRDRCGKTKPGVHEALADLTVQETTALKQTLVEPRAALDSGCRSEWTGPLDEKMLLAVPSTEIFTRTEIFTGTDGGSTIPSSRPTIAVPTEIDGMHWCRYAVEPDPSAEPESSETTFPGAMTLRTGRFVAGGTLDSGTAQLVAEVAASQPVPRSCDASAESFLVLVPSQGGQELGMTFTAELDGCELLYRDGSGVRPLPADVREILTSKTDM
jgi:hypothetical protein